MHITERLVCECSAFQGEIVVRSPEGINYHVLNKLQQKGSCEEVQEYILRSISIVHMFGKKWKELVIYLFI
jgi:hypothetical protein